MTNKFAALFENFNQYQRQLRDLYLIRRSGLFDEKWYLIRNPDVAQAKIDPLLHYLAKGGFEGRDPGPEFSSAFYLNNYTDVGQAAVNPLIHFLRYGKAEGRFISPQHDTLYGSIKQKVFCIGLNKTGTTSIELALKDFGYTLGIQMEAELLMDDWAVRDFRRIIQYCETANAFQDVPFSLDFTYPILDYAFPGSKFILTVRNNADEWYESLVRFHAQIMGVTGRPTAEDLRKFTYRGEGWLLRQQKNIFGANESMLYDEDIYKTYYTNHNDQILEYFKSRPNDLLVLNLANTDSMERLCNFLEIKYEGQKMPHLNKSTA
jgi:hypothetical protein